MDVSDPLGLIGQVIDGKYQVEAVAGSGGTAVVYRCLHLSWQRRVALKVVRVLGDMSKEHRDLLYSQLTREAGVLASLSERTSAIVQARDIGYVTTAGGHWAPYLVLEWVDGTALDEVIEHERAARLPLRPLVEAMRLLEPIAHGLALAHKHGIAHRDVKPANIFVIGDPRSAEASTKILDFGIAKVVAEAYGRNGGFARTERAFTAFTPAYGAPEQFSRTFGSTGPWTDVFGLALVLHELVTGKDAFAGSDLMELAAASSSESERPSLRDGGAGLGISAEVEAIFARAVAVDPGKRQPNAAELWRELREATHADGEPLSRLPSFVSMAPLSSDVTGVSTVTGVTGITHPASSIAHLPVGPKAHGDTTQTEVLVQPRAPSEPVRAPTLSPAPAPLSRGRWGWLAGGGAAVAASALGLGLLLHARTPAGADSTATASRAASSGAEGTAPRAGAAPAASSPPTTCAVGMVFIPGGSFFMGSDEKIALDFERPAHRVVLGAFCMDRTEVTVKGYKHCSDNGECRRASTTNDWSGIEASDHKTYDALCNIRDPEAKADHPINCVDWRMADEYCRAAGGRLPSEAEWEFAARGPDGRMYPWGDEAPSGALLNACGSECAAWGRAHRAEVSAMYSQDDGFATTAPVGSFPKGASRYGLQDVVGNVWEWVADYYAPYADGELANPHGPATGTEHVIRGGGWNGAMPAWVRPTFRYKDEADKKSHGIGFRCAGAPK